MEGRLILTAHAIVALYVWGLAGALADEAVPEQAFGYQAFSKQYCAYCHNETLKHLNGEMSLDEVDLSDASAHGALMEMMVMKLRAGAMPPVGFPRPDTDAYDDFAVYLETVLNDAAVATQNSVFVGWTSNPPPPHPRLCPRLDPASRAAPSS